MLGKPQISIFGSAHRPQNWMGLYESIGDNDVEFEIVFVGPTEPDFQLPNNFRFIKSHVKPVQCYEVASRNTTADLIMPIADDLEFRTPRPLDRLYDTYKAYDNDKLILSCRYMLNGKDVSGTSHRFFVADDSSPVMPLCGLMSRKLYRDIGGIDRNFIAVMWDLDIAMTVLALGGEVIISDVYVDEDKAKRAGSKLALDFWSHDRPLVESLWSIDRRVHFNRARPVEPFSDFRILEASQGPRGRWRGNAPVAIEKLVDSLFARVCTRAYRAIRKPARYPEYAKRVFRRIMMRGK